MSHARRPRAGRRASTLCTLAILALCAATHGGETVTLDEPATDARVKLVVTEVHTGGKIFTAVGGGRTAGHDLSAAAAFRYRERRLAPGGRDALAVRAAREFELGTMQTRVADHDSSAELPEALRLVVVRGQREGLETWCPGALMSREAVDLLELPGDPLVLTAFLPRTAVAAGAEWRPPDWASQMLATIEAVDKIEMTCRLTSVDDAAAQVEFSGRVTGQRLGANTEVDVSGHFVFDRRQQLLARAAAKYTIKTSIGTINPGIDATVDVAVERSPSASPGRLTDTWADSIPLEPPPQAMELSFDAAPWGIRLSHDRDWYIFQAILDGMPRVVILRLMNQGSLICQCNISPVASVAPGQATSPEQFEADVREALGKRLLRIESREQLPTDDGRTILRVATAGEMELAGDKGTVKLPMTWIYYLCTDRSGKQVSFMFSIEPAYLEALARRDLAMVRSLRFSAR